jgi:hypothetical protein
VAWIQVRRLDPANNGLDPDPFSLPLIFFGLANHSEKGAKQKQKQKVKAKWGPVSLPRCAFGEWPIFFLAISVLANNFIYLSVGQGSHERQRSDIMCRTPVLIGGNAVRVRIRRLAVEPPQTDAL